MIAALIPFAVMGRAAWIVARAAWGIAQDVIERDDLASDRTAAAFARLGWLPLPVLALLATMTGLATGVAALRVLQLLYVERLVEPVLVRAIARDIVPLVVGVFAAGRVAVETAVRLGAMRLSSELEALRAIGQDPVRFVVTPALAAVVLATPVQVVVVFMSAWIAMAAVLDIGVVTSFRVFAESTLDPETFLALAFGGGKALIYQIVALAVGATIGLDDTRGISAIGRQSMRAFTAGILLVIAIAVVSVVLQ